MKAGFVLLKQGKASLIIFSLSLAATIIVVSGLTTYREHKQQDIRKTEQQLANTHDTIKNLTLDLKTTEQSAEHYRQLKQTGFIGEADRHGWVQHLEAIHREMHFPPTMRYMLAPPQLINQKPASDHAAYRNNILHHDLTIELSGIDDQKFLDFMMKLDSDWHAPYRVESCQMSRDEEGVNGLKIKCILQLYSLPVKAVASR